MPIQGLSGSHAYAQGKIAGSGAAGNLRVYSSVYVPWGLVGGNWMIGGVSFGEALAGALGIPFVLGVAEGISRARYYPDFKKIRVKLLAEPGTLKLIGAQTRRWRRSEGAVRLPRDGCSHGSDSA